MFWGRNQQPCGDTQQQCRHVEATRDLSMRQNEGGNIDTHNGAIQWFQSFKQGSNLDIIIISVDISWTTLHEFSMGKCKKLNKFPLFCCHIHSSLALPISLSRWLSLRTFWGRMRKKRLSSPSEGENIAITHCPLQIIQIPPRSYYGSSSYVMLKVRIRSIWIQNSWNKDICCIITYVVVNPNICNFGTDIQLHTCMIPRNEVSIAFTCCKCAKTDRGVRYKPQVPLF